jgi:hypothetical protein
MEARYFSVLLGCIHLLGCSPAEQPKEQAATSATPQPELMETKVVAAPSQATLQALANEQIRFDQTVFRHEVDAQAYESAFVALWDRLRSTEPFEVLRQFPFVRLEFPLLSEWKPLSLGVVGIRQASLDEETISLDHPAYLAQLNELEAAGWKIIQTEWHHSEFRPGKNGQAPQSVVSFEIHSANSGDERRAIVKGQLEVTWTPDKTHSGLRIPGTIKVRGTSITDYIGKPAFTELLQIDPKKVDAKLYPRVSPLIVYDLNQDSLPEIVLAGCNLVYRNQGGGKFQHEPMLRNPIMPIGEAGILSDFNGDGHVDFVSTGKEDGLLRLWSGSVGGQFNAKPSVCFQGKYENQHTMTAADIDNDGDLDLFVGQWKQPYLRGSMPTPYYDANDGYPDTLLLNDGTGQFTDGTEAAGLATKRNRRTYSASFADLDGDLDLDLFTVCDFSGIDLYRNDGQGKFTDVTDRWVKQRHGFGMSHAVNDFDGDGVLDIYMVGMSSTTARRLDRLGLGRKGFEKIDAMRAPMTYGNRLYLGHKTGFRQPDSSDDVARTGWAWGCGATDFDLDGDLDLYVANGHLSGNSALDYCTRFWCHDVYTGTSRPNETLDTFFSGMFQGLGSNYSWNGFEHNHLFLNLDNTGFSNAAFLLDTAFEFDARSVVLADVDVDGRPDLLVVQYDAKARQQRLFVMRNQIQTKGNWIGLHIPDQPGLPANGTTIQLQTGDRNDLRQLVTGDSFTAQHPATAHFGLGEKKVVDKLVVRWPNGKTVTLTQPAVGQYHRLKI